MIVDREKRRFPVAFGVTCFAIAPVGPARKLFSMRILVAVQAAREGYGRLEILGLMAIFANHRRMFTEQRIIRPAVVEPVIGKQLLPAACRVAACAVAAKSTSVDILVARATGGKRNR